MDVGRREPGGPGQRRGGLALRLADLDHEHAVRAQPPGGACARSARSPPGRSSPVPGPRVAPSPPPPAARGRRSRRRAGWTRRRRSGRGGPRGGPRTSRPRPGARPRPGGRGRPGWRRPPPARRGIGPWPTPPRGATAPPRWRQRDGTRSGAQVDREAGVIERGQRVDGQARDHLGLRARDQHSPVDEEVERAEPPPAEHVLEGLARGPPRHHLVDEADLPLGGVVIQGRDLLGRRPSAGSLDDPADLLLRILDRRRAQPLGALVAQLAPAQGHPDSPSRRVCSSAIRASTTSSSSPASTLSSL